MLSNFHQEFFKISSYFPPVKNLLSTLYFCVIFKISQKLDISINSDNINTKTEWTRRTQIKIYCLFVQFSIRPRIKLRLSFRAMKIRASRIDVQQKYTTFDITVCLSLPRCVSIENWESRLLLANNSAPFVRFGFCFI